MLEVRNIEQTLKSFKAFSDEKRLRILSLLAGGELCACDLLDKLDIMQSGLSYQMKILTESGVVESRQEGKWVHYKINKQGTKAVIQLIKELTKIDD